MERRDLISALAGAATLGTALSGRTRAGSVEDVSPGERSRVSEPSEPSNSTVRVDIVLTE
jgi:hypothetical protein